MGTLIYLFLFLILFRFILRYLIPIFQISRAAGSRIRQMQDKMNGMGQPAKSAPTSGPSYRQKKGEYIDYEEIK